MKNIVITGVSTGIGYSATKKLIENHSHLLYWCDIKHIEVKNPYKNNEKFIPKGSILFDFIHYFPLIEGRYKTRMTTLLDLMIALGEGTYIINACRKFNSSINDDDKKLLRATSISTQYSVTEEAMENKFEEETQKDEEKVKDYEHNKLKEEIDPWSDTLPP